MKTKNRNARKQKPQKRRTYVVPSNAQRQIIRAPRAPVHRFKRSIQFSNTVWDSGGWGSSPGFGPDLEFTFSLKQLNVLLGGVSTLSVAMPSYTELQSLFAEWRLNQVKMRMFFSNNNSSINSPATSLPIFNIVFDPTNSSACPLTQALQYDNLKTLQLGNAAQAPPEMVFRPRPSLLAYDGVTSGYMTDKSGWISTQYPDVPHYCVKVVYDSTTAPGTSTLIGSVNFYFEFDFSMKGID